MFTLLRLKIPLKASIALDNILLALFRFALDGDLVPVRAGLTLTHAAEAFEKRVTFPTLYRFWGPLAPIFVDHA